MVEGVARGGDRGICFGGPRPGDLDEHLLSGRVDHVDDTRLGWLPPFAADEDAVGVGEIEVDGVGVAPCRGCHLSVAHIYSFGYERAQSTKIYAHEPDHMPNCFASFIRCSQPMNTYTFRRNRRVIQRLTDYSVLREITSSP